MCHLGEYSEYRICSDKARFNEKSPADEWIYPLVMTHIAMENGPFIDGLPMTNFDFPWLC